VLLLCYGGVGLCWKIWGGREGWKVRKKGVGRVASTVQ